MNDVKPLDDLSTILTGVAGEYFVAAELSRRGYVASVTLRNTRGMDVIATNADASRSVGISVKTNKTNKKDWMVNEKAESFYSDTLFYVFVNLKGVGENPEFHVVPSRIVATTVYESHRSWLSKSKKSGEARKDSSMRRFKDPGNKYLNRWELLGLDIPTQQSIQPDRREDADPGYRHVGYKKEESRMFEGFGGLEDLEEAFREYDSRVPHGEEAFMVLKAHLIAERALVEFIRARVADSEFDKQFLDRNSPCRNGLGLILLAQGLSIRDEIRQTCADIIWPAIKMLNSIRNTLAHELDPDSSRLRKKMTEFVRLVDGDMLTVEPDVNRAFRECVAILVLFLHIDKQPLLASDCD